MFAKRSVKSKFNSFHSTLYKIPWLFCRVCFLAECSLHKRRDTAKYSSVSNPSSSTHSQAIADISQHRSSGGGVLFSSRCTLKHRERNMLANFGCFVANLRTFWCIF